MKKYILFAVAIAIVGLMITSTASVPMKISTNSVTMDKPMIVERNDLQIIKSGISPYRISAQSLEVINAPIQLSTVRAGPVFALPGDQLHPAFARSGVDMTAAFYDEDLDNIIWTGSNDDGATFIDGVYWDSGGDYPSIKMWDDSPRFFGTFVTDYLDLNGGPSYLFECTDPMDTEAYVMTYWDWSANGWYDMIDADIACDNSQQTFEWGVSSYVTSTTYGDGYTDGPTIVYSDEDTEGSGWISWYYYDGCDHTDVDIDRSTIYSYAVYDWEDTTAGYYKLLVRVNDFDQIMNGYDAMFELDYGYNLQFPAVAAGDGNIVILAETDESGNKDIICFYGPDLSSMSTSFVVDTGDDERFPDVRHVSGDRFIATYVKGGDLYAAETTDGGATWTESRWQINDNDGSVVEEYKTSDLCENAIKAMWEEDGPDDIDIFMGVVLPNDPPGAPVITGTANGAAGTPYDYDFTATDPDGDNVQYYIDWDDGDTEWTSFAASGTPVTVSHTWVEQGDYTITAKAKDVNGLIGPEGTLPVTMPVNQNQQSQQQSVVISFVQMLQNLFRH